MDEEHRSIVVRYVGPERRVKIGISWLQPGETYELPSETVDRYPGYFADLTTAPVGSGGPGDSILDREPPVSPRSRRAPPSTSKQKKKPSRKKTKRASGRK